MLLVASMGKGVRVLIIVALALFLAGVTLVASPVAADEVGPQTEKAALVMSPNVIANNASGYSDTDCAGSIVRSWFELQWDDCTTLAKIRVKLYQGADITGILVHQYVDDIVDVVPPSPPCDITHWYPSSQEPGNAIEFDATVSYGTLPAPWPTGPYTVRVEGLRGDDTIIGGADLAVDVKQLITIRKFNDENGNGVWDAEPEITGEWDVTVTGEPSPLTMPVVDLCVFLPITITEEDKAGWKHTTPAVVVVTDADEPLVSDVEFGNQEMVSLTVFKFVDTGEPGWQAEPGVNSWYFDVYEGACPPTGGPIATLHTGDDGLGLATLDGLEPGTYCVEEQVKAGWECTTDNPQQITLPTEEILRFGNRELIGTLEVIKFEDDPTDGTYDGGEPLLDCWYFDVHEGQSVAGAFVATLHSGDDGNGRALLSGLLEGWYTVWETPGQMQPGQPHEFWSPTTQSAKSVYVPADGTGTVEFGNKEHVPVVPGLSQWGIIAMVIVFGGALVWVVRRRLVSRTS